MRAEPREELLAAARAGDPDALNLLGRIVGERGDAGLAIGLQRDVLRRVPDHPRAGADLLAASGAIRSSAEAAARYAAALALEPGIADHHANVGALERTVGMERVAALVREALLLDPSHAPAHAADGNLAARAGRRSEAMAAYARAVLLDWTFAEAHLALAQLYDTADNTRDGDRHLAAALAVRVLFHAHAPYAVRRVLVLKAPGGFLANALLDFCIDTNRTDLDAFYVTPDAAVPDLTPYDAVWNAMGAYESHAGAIERATALLAGTGRAVINHPAQLRTVRRWELPATLAAVPHCFVSPTYRVAREDVAATLATLDLPVLIRPIDTHRGDGLERLDRAADLDEYLERVPHPAYVVMRFVDYRSADGYYRKARVTVVDGVPYPYHLAISEHWLGHYWRSVPLMREHAWMRAEEERFFRDPATLFPSWATTFREIAAATGLDCFSVDCGLAANGDVLVFECDPAAFVHCRESLDDVFAYKFDYVPRIFAAIDALLSRHAGKRQAT